MRREWIGIGLLLIVLGLGLLSAWYMGNTCGEIARGIEGAGRLALSEDWEGADRLLRKARQDWDRNWRLRAMLTDHAPMEAVDSQLAQLAVYQQRREELAFAALCAQLSGQIEDIGDAHELNWWNLL